MTKEEMEARALSNWNEGERTPLHTWLTDQSTASDQDRLKRVGNIVIPRCAQLAVHLLEHSIRRDLSR